MNYYCQVQHSLVISLNLQFQKEVCSYSLYQHLQPILNSHCDWKEYRRNSELLNYKVFVNGLKAFYQLLLLLVGLLEIVSMFLLKESKKSKVFELITFHNIKLFLIL